MPPSPALTPQVSNLASAVNGVCIRSSMPPSNDPAGSLDPLYMQIIAHINDAALELQGDYQWPLLTRHGSITISADSVGQKEKAFDLPVDFLTFVDQTQWNTGTQLPALGPVAHQAWQNYLVRNWVPQLTFFWQLREGRLWVLNPPYYTVLPASPPVFDFVYRSSAVCTDADDPSIYKTYASKNGDTFILDGAAIMLLGRVKFLGAKGFDTAAAEIDYQRRIEQVIDQSIAAPVISLVKTSTFPYIGLANVPDTGYGRSSM